VNWLMEKFNLDLSLVSQLGASPRAFDLRFNIVSSDRPSRTRFAVFRFFEPTASVSSSAF